MSKEYRESVYPVNNSPGQLPSRPRPNAREKHSGSVSDGGQTRISCPPQTSSGIDKLEVTLWLAYVDHSIFEQFSCLKKIAQATELSTVPVTFGSKKHFKWNLQRTGTKQYGYVLRSGDITMQLSTRNANSNFPNCRIEIGSVTSQDSGFRTYERLLEWLRIYGFTKKKEIVSRVDLAVDFIGTEIKGLNVSYRERWVSRAKKFSVYYEGTSLTGVMLGKGDICLRIYNKTLELTQHKTKQLFFLSRWKCENDTPVTRVEFQFRRPVLKGFKIPINTVHELERYADSIWQYACNDWARLARKSIDRNNGHQKQAIISSFWLKTHGVIFYFPSLPNYRTNKNLTKDVVALREQARGCILNLAAASGHDVDDYVGIVNTCTQAIADDLLLFMVERKDEYERLFEVRRNQCYVGF